MRVGFLVDRRALSQVLYSNVIVHILRNLEFVLKRTRNKCAMTGLIIHPLFLFRDSIIIWQEFIQLLGYYVIKAAGSFVKFFLPLLGKDMRRVQSILTPAIPDS